VTYLGVQSNGLVNLAELEAAVRPGQTSLVSVMGVNNEIGVIQPLKEISAVSAMPCCRLSFLHHIAVPLSNLTAFYLTLIFGLTAFGISCLCSDLQESQGLSSL
jgi:hypothetical protein